jgi:hypothetical protein
MGLKAGYCKGVKVQQALLDLDAQVNTKEARLQMHLKLLILRETAMLCRYHCIKLVPVSKIRTSDTLAYNLRLGEVVQVCQMIDPCLLAFLITGVSFVDMFFDFCACESPN